MASTKPLRTRRDDHGTARLGTLQALVRGAPVIGLSWQKPRTGRGDFRAGWVGVEVLGRVTLNLTCLIRAMINQNHRVDIGHN